MGAPACLPLDRFLTRGGVAVVVGPCAERAPFFIQGAARTRRARTVRRRCGKKNLFKFHNPVLSPERGIGAALHNFGQRLFKQGRADNLSAHFGTIFFRDSTSLLQARLPFAAIRESPRSERIFRCALRRGPRCGCRRTLHLIASLRLVLPSGQLLNSVGPSSKPSLASSSCTETAGCKQKQASPSTTVKSL